MGMGTPSHIPSPLPPCGNLRKAICKQNVRPWEPGQQLSLRRAKEKVHVAVSLDEISQCFNLTQLIQGPIPLPLHAPLFSVLCTL